MWVFTQLAPSSFKKKSFNILFILTNACQYWPILMHIYGFDHIKPYGPIWNYIALLTLVEKKTQFDPFLSIYINIYKILSVFTLLNPVNPYGSIFTHSDLFWPFDPFWKFLSVWPFLSISTDFNPCGPILTNWDQFNSHRLAQRVFNGYVSLIKKGNSAAKIRDYFWHMFFEFLDFYFFYQIK